MGQQKGYSIKELNSSYKITVCTGYDIYGKKLREYSYFQKDDSLTPKQNRKAAEAFAVEWSRKVKNGQLMEGSKTTLLEFTERWIQEYATQNLEPGTLEKYRAELEGKVLPALGHLKLTELKPHNLNAFFVAMTKDGARKDGKPGGYSKGTITKTRNVFSAVLRTATEWEIIENNPLEKVRYKAEDTAEKLEFFTPEQAITFLQYIEEPYQITTKGHGRVDDTGKGYQVADYESTRMIPEQQRILFNIAIYGGLRKGELLALEFTDFDFAADTVSITKAVSLVNGEQIIKAPKSKAGRRTVTLPHALMQRVKALHSERIRYRLSLGEYWQGDNWVFIQENGKQMCYSTPYAAFHDAIARYNNGKPAVEQLPSIPFHGLRHTSATLLIANKQDVRTVSSRLGHAQTSTTLNIYAHSFQELDRKAVDTLETVLQKQA